MLTPFENHALFFHNMHFSWTLWRSLIGMYFEKFFSKINLSLCYRFHKSFEVSLRGQWLLSHSMAYLNSYNKKHSLQTLKYLLSGLLQKMVCLVRPFTRRGCLTTLTLFHLSSQPVFCNNICICTPQPILWKTVAGAPHEVKYIQSWEFFKMIKWFTTANVFSFLNVPGSHPH